ncbi:MAG: zinc-binding dehydrogenase [Paracoccaceae bacterium]|nr:zinc-binding dehydrogenase [Paracoccaceae bacterium]
MTDIPQKMFALVQKLDGYSGTSEGPRIITLEPYLETAEIAVPQPGAGQVLIRVRTASVNPSDLHFIKGEYGQPCQRGVPAGFEGCGDVVAAGAGAQESAGGLMGQRVAFAVTQGGSGAWAEYALTDASACIPLRPDVSDDDAAAQIVNPMSAMAMIGMAQEAAGDGGAFVMSAATSQLCKLMIALGRDKGLRPIAMLRRAEAADALRALGAAEVLVTTADDFGDRLKAVFRDLEPAIFFDAVGDQISERAFAAMPNGGRWVIYGKLDPTPPELRDLGQLIFMNKRIEGFWLTRWMRETPPEKLGAAVAEVQARFADGRWKTNVTAHLALREVMEKLPAALAQPDGKVIITPS